MTLKGIALFVAFALVMAAVAFALNGYGRRYQVTVASYVYFCDIAEVRGNVLHLDRCSLLGNGYEITNPANYQIQDRGG